MVGVQVDGNTVSSQLWSTGVFNALPYLKRDERGVIATGRHVLLVYPSSGDVQTTVAMKVIEKI